MTAFDFTVDGIADVNAMLDELSLMPKDGVGWKRLALKSKQIISQRTATGRDVRGNAFSPYSSSYLVYKEEKAGRSVNIVNLHDDGNMLSAMQVDGNELGSRLFFADTVNAEKAIKHNTGDGVPQREFFAISEPEAEELMELAEQDIDNFMGNL